MKFQIDKDILLKSLSKIQGVVEKRNTIPILSNILLDVRGNILTITATDLEIAVRLQLPINYGLDGKLTVNAKIIYEIVRELPDGELSINTKDNSWIEIKSGRANFNIVGLSSDEFPYFLDTSELNFEKIESSKLKSLIDQTFFSISNDETKYNLNGIFSKLFSDKGIEFLRFVATDGHRLSLSQFETNFKADFIGVKGVIFPKKGILELKKLCDDTEFVEISIHDNNSIIKSDNFILVMRLIDGDFPDYQRVIPSNLENSFKINVGDFYKALKRISVLSSEGTKGIKFDLSQGSLEISSSNPEFGEAKERLDINYEGNEFSIGFNAKFIIDVLNNIESDSIDFIVKDQLSPAVIKSENSDNYLAVIMPMRL